MLRVEKEIRDWIDYGSEGWGFESLQAHGYTVRAISQINPMARDARASVKPPSLWTKPLTKNFSPETLNEDVKDCLVAN